MSLTTEPKHRQTSRVRVTSSLIFLIIPIIILVLAGRGVAVRGDDNVAASGDMQSAAESIQAGSKRTTPVHSVQKQDILPHSVAVLPLKNLSPEQKNAYLATGIHKEILSQLVKIPGLNIIARASVLNPAYADGSMSIPAIAGDLNVATIMTGSLNYNEGKVRVTAQLFNGMTGTELWSDFFDGSLTDLYGFQTEIASHIAGAVKSGLTPEIRSLINRPRTRSPEAYRLYLKARALAPDGSSRIPVEYYQFLEQAIARDPYFAVAHAAMAFGLGDSLSYGVPVNGYSFPTMERIALSHLEAVMESGAEIDKAYMAQAFIHWTHQRGAPARQAFERALQLSPGDVEIMDDFSRFLSFTGNPDAAVMLARRAAALAPKDPASHYLLGYILAFAGEAAAAADSVRQSISLNSTASDPHLLLGEIEFILGDDRAAGPELEISERLSDPDTDPIEDMAIRIYAYSRLGLKQNAMRVFKHFNTRVATGEYVSISALALAYLGIGNANVAFDLLNRSPNEGMNALQHIKYNFLNDPVLETSRFQELRRRIARLSGGVANIQTPPF